MSNRKDLHGQISKLKEEIELSAFLNKGVLHTNSELKLQIAELQRENAALRIAESRLAKTEDALEEAEQRIAELEGESLALERAEEKERERRREVERDRDSWRSRWEAVTERWGEVSRGMEEIFGRIPSSHSRPLRFDAQPRATSSSRKITQTSRQAIDTTPPSPIPPTLSNKKRRRIETTPEDQNAEVGPSALTSRNHRQTYSESPRPPTPQPTRPRSEQKKERSAGQATSAAATTTAPTLPRSVSATSAKKRTSGNHNKRVSDDGKIKAEPLSPAPERFRRRYGEKDDSDDDPLAMG